VLKLALSRLLLLVFHLFLRLMAQIFFAAFCAPSLLLAKVLVRLSGEH
jgi:hypothetical protein